MALGNQPKQPFYVSMARGCFGFQHQGWMAFFTYLDASGSGTDPKVKAISVGGFVAHETVWAGFESQWQAVLDRFGVPELHMRDYAHSQGVYSGWKDDKLRRDGFMRDIAAVVKNSGLQPIGASLPLGLYRLFNRDYRVEETVGTPYTVCASAALAMGTEWRDRQNVVEPMLLYVEHGDSEQADFRRFIRGIKWEADYVAEPIIMRKKWVSADGRVNHVLPFQACDFIAYEQAKALTDLIVHRKTLLRQSLRSALTPIEDLPPGGRTYWSFIEAQTLTNVLTNFQVQRRFNHFNGGHPNRSRRIVAPLGYIDRDHPVVGFIGSDGFIEDRDLG